MANRRSDAVVTGWSVDSRTLQPGDLFFALRGPNHDGHAYVGAGASRRARSAAVVDREVAGSGRCPARRGFAEGAADAGRAGAAGRGAGTWWR